MKVLLLIALLGVSACGDDEELATCHGPIFPLNTGRWQPQPADLRTPPPIGRPQ